MEQTQTKTQRLKPEHLDEFDLIIIGAGPAGMSAAVCAGRAKLRTLLIDRALPGGQAITSCRVYNYLGFHGILGPDLAKKMEEHVAEYPIYHTCELIEDIAQVSAKEKRIRTALNHEYRAKAVIIATGLEPKKLNTAFERQFLGRGISYCAQCDASNYEGKTVVVIGGGNCACYAADYLAHVAEKIYLVHKADHIRAVTSLKEKVLSNPKIEPMWNSHITEVFGIEKVEKAKIVNLDTQQYSWVDTSAIFIYSGRIPPKEILHLGLKTDEAGFVITDEYMRTSVPGIYAAGDVRAKQVRQIATAVSDGMIAAINAERDMARD